MTAPSPEPFRLSTPDASIRIPPEQLARLRPGFDGAALLKLLGMINPKEREWVLQFFLYPTTGELVVENLVHFDDPQLQAVLEEVWAPYWELLPPEAIDLDRTDTPGREIARARREERLRHSGKAPGPK